MVTIVVLTDKIVEAITQATGDGLKILFCDVVERQIMALRQLGFRQFPGRLAVGEAH